MPYTFNFKGTDNYVDCGIGVSNIVDNVTLSVWVKTKDIYNRIILMALKEEG